MPEEKHISWTAQLKNAVQLYHAKTGVAYETIGRRAVQNPRVWERMETGGTITLATAEQLRDWLATQGYHINPQGECYVEERQ